MDSISSQRLVRSLAEDLMRALGPKVYEAGNFIVADALQDSCPICFVSQGFCNLTGYSREECLGRNCKFLQGKDTDQHAVQAIRKAISNQQEFRCTIRNYRKDGRPFWNDLHLCPVFDSFGTMCMIVGAQLEVEVPGLEQVHRLGARQVAADIKQAFVFDDPYRICALTAATAPSSCSDGISDMSGLLSQLKEELPDENAGVAMPARAKRRRGDAAARTADAGAPCARDRRGRRRRPSAATAEAVDALQRRVAALEAERARLLRCCCGMASLYADMSRTQAEMARAHAAMASSNVAVAKAQADMAERAAPLLWRLLADAPPPASDPAAEALAPRGA